MGPRPLGVSFRSASLAVRGAAHPVECPTPAPSVASPGAGSAWAPHSAPASPTLARRHTKPTRPTAARPAARSVPGPPPTDASASACAAALVRRAEARRPRAVPGAMADRKDSPAPHSRACSTADPVRRPAPELIPRRGHTSMQRCRPPARADAAATPVSFLGGIAPAGAADWPPRRTIWTAARPTSPIRTPVEARSIARGSPTDPRLARRWAGCGPAACPATRVSIHSRAERLPSAGRSRIPTTAGAAAGPVPPWTTRTPSRCARIRGAAACRTAIPIGSLPADRCCAARRETCMAYGGSLRCASTYRLRQATVRRFSLRKPRIRTGVRSFSQPPRS